MYSQTWPSTLERLFRGSVVANEPCLCHLDFFAARLVNANALTVSQQLDANTISLASCSIENCHIGLVNRHSLFNDATGRALHWIWLGVFFNQVNSIDHHMGVIFTQGDFPALTLITSRDNDNFIAFANLIHGASLQNFRSQGHDLHELLSTQFTRNGSKDAGANRLQLGIQQHRCIAIKLHQRTIATTDALGGANYNSAVDLTFFDATARCSLFNANFNNVANARIATL